jgi:two-component system, NarL family, nitrate/nitrite response regulator NarL
VLLAHQYALLMEGIALILQDAGFQVVGKATSMEALGELIEAQCPQMVLMDWDLPGGGVEAVQALVPRVQKESKGVIVILTRPQPVETFLSAMKTGVGGYLSVNLPPDEFISALRMLAKGDVVVSREVAGRLKEELSTPRENNEPKDDLSDREREVLSLISQGATNREIANSLTIAENTVKVHLRRILDKLDLRNRQQAAAYAVQEGITEVVIDTSLSNQPR